MSRNRKGWLGVTLVELLVALSVLAVISVAVTTLLAGAGRTHKYVNDEIDTLSQVENAYRRILHNVRCAADLTAPLLPAAPATAVEPTATSVPAFSITTQADTSNGNAQYTVKYYKDGTTLVEHDSRYNAVNGPGTVLAKNIATFSVGREDANAAARTPTFINITIVSNTIPAIERTVRVACRNPVTP